MSKEITKKKPSCPVADTLKKKSLELGLKEVSLEHIKAKGGYIIDMMIEHIERLDSSVIKDITKDESFIGLKNDYKQRYQPAVSCLFFIKYKIRTEPRLIDLLLFKVKDTKNEGCCDAGAPRCATSERILSLCQNRLDLKISLNDAKALGAAFFDELLALKHNDEILFTNDILKELFEKGLFTVIDDSEDHIKTPRVSMRR